MEITAEIPERARCCSFEDRYILGCLIDTMKSALIWYLGTQKPRILGIEIYRYLGSRIPGFLMARIETTSRANASQLNLLPQQKTTISLPRDLYKQLKIESAKREREMSAIVGDALRKYFSESEHAQQ